MAEVHDAIAVSVRLRFVIGHHRLTVEILAQLVELAVIGIRWPTAFRHSRFAGRTSHSLQHIFVRNDHCLVSDARYRTGVSSATWIIARGRKLLIATRELRIHARIEDVTQRSGRGGRANHSIHVRARPPEWHARTTDAAARVHTR